MFTLLETPLQSDDQYREIFARSPLGFALLDEHGLFAEVNPAMCRLLGRPAAELRGRALREFAHPEDLTEPDLSSQLEARYLNPDGEVRWAWSTATAIPGPAGELWTLLHVQDVTDHKTAELALRESAAKLAALASLARCVQMGQDPRPVAVAAARSLAGASTVAMVELSTDILVITACDGTDLTGVRLPLSGSSAAAEVWRSGAEHLQSDAGEEPPLEPAIRALEDTISTLWEPVIVEGSVIALLVVTWERRVPGLTEEAVQQVREVAAETAMALHATHLRAKLECAASTDPLTGSLNRPRATGLHARAGGADFATCPGQCPDRLHLFHRRHHLEPGRTHHHDREPSRCCPLRCQTSRPRPSGHPLTARPRASRSRSAASPSCTSRKLVLSGRPRCGYRPVLGSRGSPRCPTAAR